MSIPLAKDVALALALTSLTGCASSTATRTNSRPATKPAAIRPSGDKPCAPSVKKEGADPASEFLDLDACPASSPSDKPASRPVSVSKTP